MTEFVSLFAGCIVIALYICFACFENNYPHVKNTTYTLPTYNRNEELRKLGIQAIQERTIDLSEFEINDGNIKYVPWDKAIEVGKKIAKMKK